MWRLNHQLRSVRAAGRVVAPGTPVPGSRRTAPEGPGCPAGFTVSCLPGGLASCSARWASSGNMWDDLHMENLILQQQQSSPQSQPETPAFGGDPMWGMEYSTMGGDGSSSSGSGGGGGQGAWDDAWGSGGDAWAIEGSSAAYAGPGGSRGALGDPYGHSGVAASSGPAAAPASKSPQNLGAPAPLSYYDPSDYESSSPPPPPNNSRANQPQAGGANYFYSPNQPQPRSVRSSPLPLRSGPPPGAPQGTIVGSVERVVFFSANTKYLVARLRTSDGRFVAVAGSTTVVPAPGDQVTVAGAFGHHPRFGQQFEFSRLSMGGHGNDGAGSPGARPQGGAVCHGWAEGSSVSAPAAGAGAEDRTMPRRQAPTNQGTNTAVGWVLRVAFRAAGGGWTALVMEMGGQSFMAVGRYTGRDAPEPGTPLRLAGKWGEHPRYGVQFEFELFTQAPELGPPDLEFQQHLEYLRDPEAAKQAFRERFQNQQQPPLQPASQQPQQVFRGEVSRVVFQSPQTGYTVLKCFEAGGGGEEVTVVGTLRQVPAPMEPVQYMGKWVEHPRFGRQFQLPYVAPSEGAAVHSGESPQYPLQHQQAVSTSSAAPGEMALHWEDASGGGGHGAGVTPDSWSYRNPGQNHLQQAQLEGAPVRVLGSIAEVKYYSPTTSWCVLAIQPLELEGQGQAEAGSEAGADAAAAAGKNDADASLQPAFHYQDDPVTVSCFMIAPPEPGAVLDLEGTWTVHETFGPQIRVKRCAPLPPTGAEAIRDFLIRAHLPGLGPELIYRVVDNFGDETLAVLEGSPERLAEVPGIDLDSAAAVGATLRAHQQQRQLSMFFQSCQVPSFLADRIQLEYGLAHTEEVVRRNPYALVGRVAGVSFATADRIAKALDWEDWHPERLRAGLLHTLESLSVSLGHCYAEQPALLSRAGYLLSTRGWAASPEELLKQLLALAAEPTSQPPDATPDEELVSAGATGGREAHPRVVRVPVDPVTAAWYLPDVYRTERRLAARVRQFLGLPPLVAEDGCVVDPSAPLSLSASASPASPSSLASSSAPEDSSSESEMEATELEQPRERVQVDRAAAEAWLDEYAAEQGLDLSATQREAVLMVLSPPPALAGVGAPDSLSSANSSSASASASRLSVITGGPGTGKTFCVKVLAAGFQRFGLLAKFMSPTGRGASRLKEVTGQDCSTVHRALLSGESGVETIRWLRADVVIVDEASMVDVFMADAITHAMSPHARLVLIGDSEQLPSVGPGALLTDLLQTPGMPTVALDTIYRQAGGSGIVSNAHHIRRGLSPVLQTLTVDDILSDGALPGTAGADAASGLRVRADADPVAGATTCGDCFFLDSTQLGAETALDYVMGPLLAKLGVNETDDVQVLTPMSKGEYGSRALNAHLRRLMRARRAATQLLEESATAERRAFHGQHDEEPGETASDPLGDDEDGGDALGADSAGSGSSTGDSGKAAAGFTVGERVIQGHNNYEKMVFNGEIGVVTRVETLPAQEELFETGAGGGFGVVHSGRRRVHVQFKHRTAPVVYDADTDARELYPAWAITIHKSQGSEYEVAVIFVHERHSFMLSRQLVYTALTRARRYAVFVGSKPAIDRAVRLWNPAKHRRQTRLLQLVTSQEQPQQHALDLQEELREAVYSDM